MCRQVRSLGSQVILPGSPPGAATNPLPHLGHDDHTHFTHWYLEESLELGEQSINVSNHCCHYHVTTICLGHTQGQVPLGLQNGQ